MVTCYVLTHTTWIKHQHDRISNLQHTIHPKCDNIQDIHIPARLMRSTSMLLVSCAIMDEPAALGCTAVMSPDRPMPWPRLQGNRIIMVFKFCAHIMLYIFSHCNRRTINSGAVQPNCSKNKGNRLHCIVTGTIDNTYYLWWYLSQHHQCTKPNALMDLGDLYMLKTQVILHT